MIITRQENGNFLEMSHHLWRLFGLSYDRVKALPADEYGDLVEYVLNDESRGRVVKADRKAFEINLARYVATISAFAEHQKDPAGFVKKTYQQLLGDGEGVETPIGDIDVNNPFFKTAMRAMGKTDGNDKSDSDN